MNALARLTLAPAIAALAVVLFEVLRTSLFGATRLGGEVFGFALAVAGMLGLPLWLAGTLGLTATGVTAFGWRWGRGGLEPVRPERVVGWMVHGALSLALVTFGTQMATMRFVAAFRKPIYQGLAAGLVAACIVILCAALAGWSVGIFSRLARAASRRLPPFLDPTRPRAAAGWIVLLLILGAILAPIIVAPLHTVDLRPARLMLFWALALAVATWWVARRPRTALHAIAGIAVGLVFGGCLAWSAGSLGESQQRRLALDRHTLVAGPVAARLVRLGDADGDGVPGLFAGGDCNDADPKIRPGVYDRPGDGIDQNCTGSDLDRAADPIRTPERAVPGPRKPWNVLLLTIDALRHDTMVAHMPRLNALAAEGIDVRYGYSHGAATYWSIPALMTSTLPSRLHMGRDETPVKGMTLLTEVLRDNGWHTALFANVTVFFVRGLRQGTHVADYDTSKFTVHGAKPGSAHMTDGILRHIDRQQAGRLRPKRDRFFVWGHYYDPHDPYFEVEGYPAENGSDKARYEAIARYVDDELGRLFDGLKSRGLWDSTVIILTADHGDEFLDHGHRFHGRTLYDEMVRVPLLLKVPEVPHRTIETPMGQIEVAPTVLELLGIPIPEAWVGRSRATEFTTGQPAPIEPVFFEIFPDNNYKAWQVGMRLGDLKLIYRLDQNYFEMYDLAADPLERVNVFDSHPDAATMTVELLTYVDHHLWYLGQGRTTVGRKPEGSPKRPAAKKKKPKRKKTRPRPPPRPAPKVTPPEKAPGPPPAKPAGALGPVKPAAPIMPKLRRDPQTGAPVAPTKP